MGTEVIKDYNSVVGYREVFIFFLSLFGYIL